MAGQCCQQALTISAKPKHARVDDCIDPRAGSVFLLIIGFNPVQRMSQLELIFDADNKTPRPVGT